MFPVMTRNGVQNDTKMRKRDFRKFPKRCSAGLRKNYKLLKTSWGVQSRLFFEHSTLHGVRYIAEIGRPFLERFLWFACVIIGTVTSLVIIISLWEKFQTNPTITGLDTNFHEWVVPFPAVIICPDEPANDTIVAEYVMKIMQELKDDQKPTFDVEKYLIALTDWHQIFEEPDVFKHKNYTIASELFTSLSDISDVKTFIHGFTQTCDEIFESCSFKSEPIDCCESFFPVLVENGFCYAFNSRHYESILPGSDKPLPRFTNSRTIEGTDASWTLTFTVREEENVIPIYILSSDEEVGIDVLPQYIWDYMVNDILFSVKHTYTTENARQLSVKQRHCYFRDERRLKIDSIYTYTGCTKQCRMDNAMRLCNCVPFFYPEIANYRYCDLMQLRCIAQNIEDIKAVDSCGCLLGCSNTVYEIEKLHDVLETTTRGTNVSFVSWPVVRYKREVLFGWVDLLVSFGGIAGLFLGFSLLSGVEILYYFTIRVVCMVVQEKDELERIQIEERSKPPEDYSLSLTPFLMSDPLPGSGINEVAKRYYRKNLLKINNKVRPLPLSKLKPKDVLLPPFGIEFLN